MSPEENLPESPLPEVDRGPASTDDAVASDLVDDVYQQLRRLAQSMMGSENPGQTIQATALVHEAYLKLDRYNRPWEDSQHFFIVAARAMRLILVDRARSKASKRRGGGRKRLDLDEADAVIFDNSVDFVSLDEALDRLAQEHERASQIVLLRYFAGLNNEQVAQTLGISPATAARDWVFARAHLYRTLNDTEP